MLHKINRILEKALKLRLVKLVSVKSGLSGKPPSLIVEFVGPSGVGKTTLCNAYLDFQRLSVPGGNILTRKYVEQLDALEPSIKGHSLYNTIFEHKINDITRRKNESFFSKYSRVESSFNCIKADLLITNSIPNRLFILDQHIIQLHRRTLSEIRDEYDLRELYENRLVIYCTTSPETIVKQIKKRAKTTEGIQPFHDGLTDEELFVKEAKIINIWEEDMEIHKNHGMKVLRIDTQNNMEENCLLVDNFIKKHLE